jgi:hypothetical protein
MSPGPIPKRDAERRRNNDPAGGPTTVVDISAIVEDDPDSLPFKIKQPIPESAWESDPDWHEIAKIWFESLSSSGQAVFYEPSDWALARLTAESISRDLSEQVVGITDSGEVVRDTIPLKGASLNAYLKAMGQLAVSEGERRRMRIELHNRYTEKKAGTVTPIGVKRREHLS